jgi:HSP20 family protein
MAEKQLSPLAPAGPARSPFNLLRQMTAELDHMFEDWPTFRFRAFRPDGLEKIAAWSPKIDVVERDNRLVTRVDLPGMKKEDIHVEVADGQLAISGERKQEREEKKDNVYRSEREYGSFYRAVPLPEDVKPEDIQATFADGVLEVSIPLPAAPVKKAQKIAIQEAAKA